MLARNRGQHGDDLTSLTLTHDKMTLAKHPRPFFASEDELSTLTAEGRSLSYLLMPAIKVDAAGLETALSEVEALDEWIEGRLDRAHD